MGSGGLTGALLRRFCGEAGRGLTSRAEYRSGWLQRMSYARTLPSECAMMDTFPCRGKLYHSFHTILSYTGLHSLIAQLSHHALQAVQDTCFPLTITVPHLYPSTCGRKVRQTGLRWKLRWCLNWEMCVFMAFAVPGQGDWVVKGMGSPESRDGAA